MILSECNTSASCQIGERSVEEISRPLETPSLEIALQTASIIEPSMPTPTTSASKTIQFDTDQNNGNEASTVNTVAYHMPRNTTPLQDSLTMNTESENGDVPQARLTIVQQSLLERVSQLQQTIQSIRKIDSVQRGKSLVREYELKIELEALCEDVVFLRDKEKRLGQTIHALKKNAKSLHRDSNSGEQERRKSDLLSKPTKNKISLSDASVQTDDWSSSSGLV